NTVRATVEGGASIDAADAVAVKAELDYPTLAEFLPDLERIDLGDPDNGDWMTAQGDHGMGRYGQDLTFNVWANTTSTSDAKFPAAVSVAGSSATAGYRNVVEATIGS